MKIRFALASLLAVGCAPNEPTSAATASAKNIDSPAALPCIQAQEAYAAGDLAAVGIRVVECLRDPSSGPLVQQNMAELLEASYAVGKGKLPSDVRRPEGVTKLRLSQRLAQPENLFVLDFSAETLEGIVVENLQLLDAQGQVLLERGGEGAEWEALPNAFNLKKRVPTAFPNGLYQIVVKLAGHEPVSQWAPVTGWRADATPELTTPAHNASLSTPNPTVEWKSLPADNPSYRWTGLTLTIARSEPPEYRWDPQWTWKGPATSPTTAQVGITPGGTGESGLRPGRHLVLLTRSESRSFGELSIVRSSSHKRTFFVRP